MNIESRMLTPQDSSAVLKTMVAGFSDYIIKVDINEEGYGHKFALDGVDYHSSAGAFADGKLIGVTMNGVGEWNGAKTAYDAGTVVLSKYRSKGASNSMFELLSPTLSDQGFTKYLLEVISNNEAALRLYDKFGFFQKRTLGVFYKNNEYKKRPVPPGAEIRGIALKEIEVSGMFSDQGVAWQNSCDWIRRSDSINYGLEYIGVYVDNVLCGIAIVSPRSGKVLRLHVREDYRRKGFGALLLNELQKYTKKDLVFLNLDMTNSSAVKFLESTGCELKIEQYEMEKNL